MLFTISTLLSKVPFALGMAAEILSGFYRKDCSVQPARRECPSSIYKKDSI